MPDTLARIFQNPPQREVVEGPVAIQPPQALAYSSWSEYFQQHREEQAQWAPVARPAGTRPLQVRPCPRPFTPHPKQEIMDVSSNDSNTGDQEEVPSGDTIPNTPEHPMTPLEQIEEDDMRRLHPAFPLNADLIAAGDNGIVLTEEQHRILTSQLEGSTTIYSLPENRQRVEGNKPYLSMMNEEQATLTQAHDTLQFGIGLKETNADPERPNITDLIRPGDPPILMAFAQELENWPALDQFLDETFREER